MRDTSSDRSGVLIVRLWIETNHQQQLRARITQTLDTMTGEESVTAATSSDEICAVVKRWVHKFINPGSANGHGQLPPDHGGDGS